MKIIIEERDSSMKALNHPFVDCKTFYLPFNLLFPYLLECLLMSVYSKGPNKEINVSLEENL